MRTLPGLFLTLLLAVTYPALVSPPGHAFPGDECIDHWGDCPSAPDVQGTKYVYSYDADSGILRRAQPRTGHREASDKDKRVWEYAYTPACMFNGPPDSNGQFANDGSCLAATDHPECAAAEFAMLTYRRLVVNAAGRPVTGDWDRRGITCFGPEEEWTREELRQIAQNLLGEYLEEHASQGEIRVQPEGGSLVNLPVVAHTRELPDIGFAITQPFPGRLDASASYEWNFGEGETQTGPGIPYTEDISPLRNPECYIAHPYTTAGTKTITLTTAWQATFTVVGIEIPVEQITFTSTATIDVHTARSELVAGDE